MFFFKNIQKQKMAFIHLATIMVLNKKSSILLLKYNPRIKSLFFFSEPLQYHF